MSELIIDIPDDEDEDTSIADMEMGEVFRDSDGDYCVQLKEGIINIRDDGDVVVYNVEELEDYTETFGHITLCPELRCRIVIEENL